MAENKNINKKELFNNLLIQGHLYEAIAMLKSISERNMLWEITDLIKRVEESYRYMLRYAMDNVSDPHRDIIYNNIKEDLRVIYDRLSRQVNIRDNSSVYYSVLRTGDISTIADSIDRYLNILRKNDPFSVASGTSAGTSRLEVETIENTLFENIWLCFPYTIDDSNALSSMIKSPIVPSHVKIMAISAIMLGSFEYFDRRRAEILIEVYSSEDNDEQIRMTALTSLLLMLYINRKRSLPSELLARIDSLHDIPQWVSDIKIVYLELIRTRDTDRIVSKLRDEIVPEMIKMKPEIDKRIKIDFDQNTDPSELEENPEWQDFLESSGIADKMKELSEIQEEGGDVLMGTFSNLKSYPFFYQVANWFRPFHIDNSIVAQLGDISDVFGELMTQSSFMCDSDKYSFVLAFASMPEDQRNMIISQIKAQNINAAELQNASLNLSTDTRKNLVNKYIQNLYRFFKLFRRREDFTNPFDEEINLTEVKPLQKDFLQDSTLQLVGEFYFKHHYYKEALKVFKLRETHIFPDATLYQKMGYCCQQLGDLRAAINYYEQSELFTGNNAWTTKRLADAYRQTGDYDKAIDYYERFESIQPDKFSTTMNIGQCYLAISQYEKAAKAFYKAQYLDENSEKPLRPLAWALLMQKDIDGAKKIYDKILDTAVRPLDFLNRGHVALAESDFHSAIYYYNNFVKASTGGWNYFLKEFENDAKSLYQLGVDKNIIPLVIDAVKYSEN